MVVIASAFDQREEMCVINRAFCDIIQIMSDVCLNIFMAGVHLLHLLVWSLPERNMCYGYVEKINLLHDVIKNVNGPTNPKHFRNQITKIGEVPPWASTLV